MWRLIALSIAAPRRALVVVLVIASAVSTGALHLHFDFSPQQVYGGQHEAVAFSEEHKRLFRYEDSIAFIVLESVDDRSLIRAEVLHWMKKLSDHASRLAGVMDVTSLVTLEAPRLNLRQRELQWTPLVPERRFDDGVWLQRRLKHMPLLNDLLISEDRSLALTLVSLDPTGRDIDTTRQRINALRDVLNRLGAPEGARVVLSGVPAIRVDVVRSLVSDQLIMTPLSAALFIGITLLMYRSWRVTAVALMSVVAATGLTLGIMGWCDLTFSILSNVVPVLVMIIGAANCVHIIGRLQTMLVVTKLPVDECVRRVMKEMSRTCFLTLATTAIGFGSLLMARSEMLQLLAVQSVIGMMCNYVCLMLVLAPGLTLTVDHSVRTDRTSDASKNETRPTWFWDRTARFVCNHAGVIVAVHLMAAAAAVASAMNLRVNSYMFETYEPDHPVVEVAQSLNEKMSGLISLEVQLLADQQDRWFSADMVASCDRIRRELRQDNRITFTRDYVELLSAFDERVLADDRQIVESGLRRVQRNLSRIDRPEIMSAFLANEQPKARIMLRVRDIGSSRFQELFARVEEVLQHELPDDVEFQLTGDAWLHTVCMDQFVRDLFYSLLAASGIIFVMIGLLFRSVGTGLVSAAPNLFPLIMTLGYMYLRDYELTAGNVIVFAISLGIAVDDTIHFLARYHEESKRDTVTPIVIAEALRSSGRAIFLTSLLVVSGLSVLVFSDFLPTRRFGELTAITMLAALPGDVILLPALLSLRRVRRST
ncbi:MAG: MMPL family transporter [Fuerstiella sp.]|nr:MMPL family transporter [Fuerstiella sp.]